MSQRGSGFRGGKYKGGRNRHSPYSRGGGGGGFRKGPRNSDGIKTDLEGFQEVVHPEAPASEVGGDEAGFVGSGTVRPKEGLPQADGGGEEVQKRKYSVKARVFVGNLPKDTNQDTIKEMFEQFGEVREAFVQKDKNFGFVRMAYRNEAEAAVAALDCKPFKGREMKVRFASSNSAVKVSNLHPMVSNELLEEAFSQFGEVEKAVVVTDERGKSLGHGIVDFSRKGYAQNAIRRCTEDHFLMTKTPMPILVEEFLRDNDEDGQPDRAIPKTASFRAEREVPPRFAPPNSVEHAVATQWKMAYESEKRQRDELEQHLRQARSNLVNEMENIREQHQTELLRQELAHHQQEQLRLVQQLRMRQGSLAPPAASLLEPNGTGGVASLFPGQVPSAQLPPVPLSAVQQTPGDRPLEESQAVLENPSYGAGNTASAVGSSSYPGAMVPPPLMGQHSLF